MPGLAVGQGLGTTKVVVWTDRGVQLLDLDPQSLRAWSQSVTDAVCAARVLRAAALYIGATPEALDGLDTVIELQPDDRLTCATALERWVSKAKAPKKRSRKS